MSSPSYYRDRAICAKILREGTGIAADRMSDRQIRERIAKHINMLRCHASDSVLSDPVLVRAIVELDDLYSEMMLRGVQLTLPI